MSMPLPPVPQKTGHILYAVITAVTWWIFSPALFLLGGLLGNEVPAVGGLLIIVSILASLTAPAVWIIKSANVSATNRKNAEHYQQQIARYNAQFYGQQQQWYPR